MEFSHTEYTFIRQCMNVHVYVPDHAWLLISWPCPCLVVSSEDLWLHWTLQVLVPKADK